MSARYIDPLTRECSNFDSAVEIMKAANIAGFGYEVFTSVERLPGEEVTGGSPWPKISWTIVLMPYETEVGDVDGESANV